MELECAQEELLPGYLTSFDRLIGDQRTGVTFRETVKGIITAGSLVCQRIASRSAILSKSKEGGQLTLPQGTAKVVIYLFNYEASGWAAFDDVSLVRTDQSTPNETSYYFFGGRRVAMRTSDEVYYLHGDHLGSTSLVTEPDNSVKASQRYRPYGEVRPLDGTVSTDRTCTDRRDEPQWDTSHDQIMVAAISSSTKRETGCPGATVLLAPS